MATLTFLVGGLQAQPASITTVPAPLIGPAIFDASGNLYFFQGGRVTPGAAQTQNGGGSCLNSNGFFSALGPCSDAYVGKIDASGNLVFGTYLGGSTADQSTAVAVDSDGNVFVTGSTKGSFPTSANAAITVSQAATSFAAKLSADGRRVLYSTYLPDAAATPSTIAVDARGNAYIGGKSHGGHAFALKVSADGSNIVYTVSLGGSLQDAATAIAVDPAGNVLVVGQTTSLDFPVTSNALQSRLKGTQDGFITKLDPRGQVVFSTFLGGSDVDTPTVVQTDPAGNIYVAGQTSSFDFPTTTFSLEPAPMVPMWNDSAPGGFVAKISGDGSALSWSTYLMSADHPFYLGLTQLYLGVAQLAVASSGDVYVAGLTGPGFPVTASAPQICFDGLGATNAFVAHLDSRGILLDATYSGQGVTFTQGLSLPGDGSILLAYTSSGGNMRSQLRFGGTGWSAPACLSSTILNSATLSPIPYSDTGRALVPGELITLTGFGIGPDVGVGTEGEDIRQLGGTQVLFDGQPAPLLYSQSRQLNAVVPTELNGHSTTNITVVHDGSTVGAISASVMSFGFPGIFRLQPGVSSQAAALNQDGLLNTPSNPALRGSAVSVWGTGFGLISPPCATGSVNPPVPVNLAHGISVDIASVTTPGTPAQYTPALYAGSAPNLPCGVVQINFLVPTEIPAGAHLFRSRSLMALPDGSQLAADANVGFTIWVK